MFLKRGLESDNFRNRKMISRKQRALAYAYNADLI